MILSSCHHYSLNNDCHGHCDCHSRYHCHCHYMQRVYVYFILTSLALPYLVLSCLEWTIRARVTLHYHIISYVFLFYLFCWFVLHSILFYSILFYFISNRFDWIWFTVLFSVVSHVNEWFVSICLSIRLFVYLYE